MDENNIEISCSKDRWLAALLILKLLENEMKTKDLDGWEICYLL